MPMQNPPARQDSTVREEATQVAAGLMPWMISLLVHAGILLLAVFIVWSAKLPEPPEDVYGVSITKSPDVPQFVHSVPTDPTTPQSDEQSARPVSIGPRSNPFLPSATDDGSGRGFEGVFLPAGDNPFKHGLGTPGDERFKVGPWGHGANARRFVFVVDASGSLIDTLPFVITELKRLIFDLDPEHEFAVLFYNDQGVHEVGPPRMKKASDVIKSQRIAWLDEDHVIARGEANPIAALRTALVYHPQVIFLLSDNITGRGIHEVDQRKLLADIARHNESNTAIYTIQYIYPDPLERFGLKPTMKLIAERTGGKYKFLDARELGLR